MNATKLASLIADGTITVDELAEARDLIERAKLVKAGIEACKKNIIFPLGEVVVQCYHYTDCAGEYSSWGTCTYNGWFSCSCNWGGDHIIGQCNLFDFKDVFMAFETGEFASDLERFLRQQIKKAK